MFGTRPIRKLRPRVPRGLRRVTLGRKLFGGFAVIALMLVAVVSVSLYVSNRLGSATNKITTRAEPALIGAYEVGQDASQLAYQQVRYVLDRGASDTAYSHADQALGVALNKLSVYAAGNFHAVKLVTALQNAFNTLEVNNDNIMLEVQGHESLWALQAEAQPETEADVSALQAAAQKYIAFTRRQRAGYIAAFHSSQASGRLIELVLAGVALLAALLIGFLITRGIKRGVEPVLDRLRGLNEHCAADLCEALQRMADGDLTQRIDPVTPPIERVGRDELGQIAQAVNGIRERMLASIEAYNASRDSLKRMIGSVAETADTVGRSSEQMAATSEEGGRSNGEIARAVDEIAQGAERQAQMIELAKSAVEDVVTAASSSAEEARMTAAAAVETRNVARAGVSAAEEASQVMTAVRDSALAVNHTINELASKSDQIGRIVETITRIAKQTNLLALNAAIEAARAGDQGRSFAVVAEQVRALAEESQVSAREIAELIGAIQQETQSAVSVVEEGARRTVEGTTVVEQTREAFTRIGESIEDMTSRIEAIAAGSAQIAHSANAMHDSVTEVASVAEQSSAATEQVSAATQQTYASAQEIASRAHNLSRTAEELNTLVKRFKLGAAPLPTPS
jgi:methyl-accepting chemotaxis protein